MLTMMENTLTYYFEAIFRRKYHINEINKKIKYKTKNILK